MDSIVEKLGTHCVVKPGTEGSALGVFIVEGAAAIGEAIEKAFDIDSEVLVERYIKGKELTVAVIGDAEVEALPIIEIVPKSDFYDLESKYAPGGSQHSVPRRCRMKRRGWCKSLRFVPTARCRAKGFRALISFWKKTVRAGRWRRIPFPA